MARKILITGGTSGIGLATAEALSEKGHHVIATGHTEADVAAMKEYVQSKNLPIDSFKLDITQEADRKLISNYQIDVLINCAGMGESGSLAEIPMDRLRKNFETNVFGTIALCQEAFKQMIPRNSGTIVIISSLAGRSPRPFLGSYSTSKYVLSAAAAILKQELRYITKNVHVAVVEPGSYHTGYNQRMMQNKYEWMGPDTSYFWNVRDKIEKAEQFMFKMTEYKSLNSIVAKIVRAAEAENPRLRYVAPWWEGAIVQLSRIFGT
ncbi:MAG: SDR family NAD(P)-dependent oxidoreductase [Bacteroidetes bacterium]|nr:SDR family NAD(P)-dependent oxidoreductase [Bacteroidota bacterium]